MYFTLLGAGRQTEAPYGVEVAGRRPSAVLELLLLHANDVVSVDRIIDELWPDDPPATARNSVQRFVADLRAALGEDRTRLETASGGYRLVVGDDELDLFVVQRHRASAIDLQDRPDEAIGLLIDALGRFGPSGGWSRLTPTGLAELERHETLRVELLEMRLEVEVRTGLGHASLAELEDLHRRYPYREGVCGLLLRALQSVGRRLDGLRVYEEFRRRLADDTGLEPSDELRALERELLDGGAVPPVEDPPERLTPVGPLSTPNLVGRDQLLADVTASVRDHALVTLVGAGGVGKTSAATAVVAELSRAGTEVAVVRLAEVRPGHQIAHTVASAMGLRIEGNDETSTIEEIADALQRRPRLLLLDNAEHVLDALAPLVDTVLSRTSARLIVTSRERLGHPDEVVVPVRPLELPAGDRQADGSSESELLFRLRAQALGVDLTDRRDEVASIVGSLDGLPLAIELAASQLEHLGVRDLADRLDHVLSMRGHRPDNERHASLGALLQWSWDGLTSAEAELLELLAVFRSRVTTDTVEVLGGYESLHPLRSLVAKHLVGTVVDDGRARYALPVTVRLFARDQARAGGRDDRHRQRHAEFLLDFLRRWPVAETNAWLDTIGEIEAHQLEYSTALEWLDQTGQFDDLIEMVARLTGLWGRLGPATDLVRWAARLGELEDERDLTHEQQVVVTVAQLEANFRIGDYGLLAKFGERLVVLEDEHPTDLGTTLVGFYGTAIYTYVLDPTSRARVETAAARAPHTEAALLNTAQTEMWLGSCQLMNREFEHALETFTSVLARTRRPGGTVMWAELGQLVSLHILGRTDEALELLPEVTSGRHDSIWNYSTEIVRAVLMASDGEVEEARRCLAIAARRRIGDRRPASRDDFQIGFGLVAEAAGETELARELLTEAMAQSPVLAALVANHVYPDVEQEHWSEVWRQEGERRLASAMRRFSDQLPPVDDELRRWWKEFTISLFEG